MYIEIRNLVILSLLACTAAFWGCGTSPSKQQCQPGRVIFKNSVPPVHFGGSGIGSHGPEGWPVEIKVTVEDEVTYVTSGEAKDVTKESGPLPGGYMVTIEAEWFIGKGGCRKKKITALIDSNVFIEAFVNPGSCRNDYEFEVYLRQIPSWPKWE